MTALEFYDLLLEALIDGVVSANAIVAGRSLSADLGTELGESGSTATPVAPASDGASAHGGEPVHRNGVQSNTAL